MVGCSLACRLFVGVAVVWAVWVVWAETPCPTCDGLDPQCYHLEILLEEARGGRR